MALNGTWPDTKSTGNLGVSLAFGQTLEYVAFPRRKPSQRLPLVNGAGFDPKTWDNWTKAEQAKAIPGAVEFTKYADSKGVKVFYITNRTADQKEVTEHNLQALGFPMGGNVDTFMLRVRQITSPSRAMTAPNGCSPLARPSFASSIAMAMKRS